MSTHTTQRPPAGGAPESLSPPKPRGRKWRAISLAFAGTAATATAVVSFFPGAVGGLGKTSPEGAVPGDSCLDDNPMFLGYDSGAVLPGGPPLGVTIEGDIEGATGALVYRATTPTADSPPPPEAYTDAAWVDFPADADRSKSFAVPSDPEKTTWIRVNLAHPAGSAACGPEGRQLQYAPAFEDVPAGSLPPGIPLVGF